jgi:hypothetical protein
MNPPVPIPSQAPRPLRATMLGAVPSGWDATWTLLGWTIFGFAVYGLVSFIKKRDEA